MHNSTTGGYSTAVGTGALESQTTGSQNNAFGYFAATSLTTGSENVCIGSGVASNSSSTTFSKCVLVGTDVAQGAAFTGEHNTLIGRQAGYFITSGENNSCLGSGSGTSSSPSGNIGTGDNTICLGDNNITALFCADTSISSSDERDKADITDFNIGLEWINALRPVTYKWDKRTWYGTDAEPYGTPDGSKKKSSVNIGFLAQEMLAVEKTHGYGNTNDDSLIVMNNLDEMSYGIKYERLVPILVNAIKELSVKVTALEAG